MSRDMTSPFSPVIVLDAEKIRALIVACWGAIGELEACDFVNPERATKLRKALEGLGVV